MNAKHLACQHRTFQCRMCPAFQSSQMKVNSVRVKKSGRMSPMTMSEAARADANSRLQNIGEIAVRTSHAAMAVCLTLAMTMWAPTAEATQNNTASNSIESLLSDAIAYVTDLTALPVTGNSQQPPVAPDDGKVLLNKLTQERDRLKKEAERDQKEKAEKKKLKQLQEQTKSDTVSIQKLEEELKAAQAEAVKRVREEETAKRQQEIDARKAAEAQAKEADTARVRAENERREAERARDRALRRRDTIVAAAGGAGLGVILSFASEIFRFVGGPTIIASLLRTPGYVLGKTFRMVEWDLQACPREPDGAMVRVTIRPQLTPGGLREAVAKSYGLDSSKHVKQFAHCVNFNSKVFYERLEDRNAIARLPDGAVLVWTQVSPSMLQIPGRSDRLPCKPHVGENIHNVVGVAAAAQEKESRVVEAIALEMRAARTQAGGPSPHAPLPPTSRAQNGREMRAAAPAAVATYPDAADAAHAPLSAAWLLSLKDPVAEVQVQESVGQLGRLPQQTESAMVAAAAGSDPVVLKLFEWYGEKNVFSFVSYVRAHLIRTGTLIDPQAAGR